MKWQKRQKQIAELKAKHKNCKAQKDKLFRGAYSKELKTEQRTVACTNAYNLKGEPWPKT